MDIRISVASKLSLEDYIRLDGVSPAFLDAILDYDPWLDYNDNGNIGMKDVAASARAFGSFRGHPRWNPKADVYLDDRIDVKDVSTIARNFGRTYSKH